MYFNSLPLIGYPDFDNQTTTVALTNILTRSAFLREILENTAIFYDYQVKNNETPEIIADKLYDDPHRHWIVLMFNQIMNPLYEFPLDDIQLRSLITTKYNQTIEQSQTTIHHYEQRSIRDILLNNILQSSNTEIHAISAQQASATTGAAETTPSLPGTADTYIDIGASTQTFNSGITVVTSRQNWAISNYNHEVTENEKRRNIKLLDKRYVVPVENEFRRLMRNG